jgi:hypothetical protein
VPDITADHRQPAIAGFEPPVGIEPTRSRLQGGCSTTELRRPAGIEFIGSQGWATPVPVSVKDDLLDDFPHVYPGRTRPEIERLLSLLDDSASTEGRLGLSIATAIKPLAPDVARRIESYNARDADEYVRMLLRRCGATASKWRPDSQPPTPDSISTEIGTIKHDG